MVQLQVSATVFCLTALMLIPGCGGPTPPAAASGASAGAAAPPTLVKAAVIRQEQIAPEFRATGNVRPRHFSIVASGADGVVAEFPIEVGDFVQQGTLISKLRMESTELELAEQEAMVRAHQAELAELQSPRKEDVDEARARQSAMEVTFSNAQRRLEVLRPLSKRGAANPSEVHDAA